jgi:hypothetical protein
MFILLVILRYILKKYVRVVPFKRAPNNNRVLLYRIEVMSCSLLPPCNALSQLPASHSSQCHPWLLGCCCRQLRRSCAYASTMYSRAERVFVREHSSLNERVYWNKPRRLEVLKNTGGAIHRQRRTKRTKTDGRFSSRRRWILSVSAVKQINNES